MSIRSKAMLYTAAYIGGAVAVGAAVTLLIEYAGMLVATSALAVFVFGYLAKTVYNIKLRELERGE